MATDRTSDRPGSPLTRRGLLRRAGAGAAAASALGLAQDAVPAAAAVVRPSTRRFDRIFHALPPFQQPSARLTGALIELGRPGGVLDAKDPLERGAKDLIVDLSLSAGNPNNELHTAGTTFLGQFIDHDMTFDTTSQLGVATRPETTPNARTPALDLDTVYGAGPVASQAFYDPADRSKLAIESNGVFEDLPRSSTGRAIIPEPRNDENLIIAGLHAAFIRAHNAAVDLVRTRGASDPFGDARRLVTWHYQWIIVHEFLPQIVGHRLVRETLRHGTRIYRPARGAGAMPVEFQGAAFRFGHSMVRPSYRANLGGDSGQPFFALVFDPTQDGVADPADMRGGSRSPRRFIDWQTFFDFGDGQVKPNKRIDAKISTPLMNLPLGAIASHQGPTSLPQRNLLRQLTWRLPSGQAIAKQLQLDRLSAGDLPELRALGSGLERSTPLWYYVLKEAEVMADGLRLGPVGGRIVVDVLVGLLRADPTSYLVLAPDWRPTLPVRGGDSFRMVDLLTFAGVDPQSRAAALRPA